MRLDKSLQKIHKNNKWLKKQISQRKNFRVRAILWSSSIRQMSPSKKTKMRGSHQKASSCNGDKQCNVTSPLITSPFFLKFMRPSALPNITELTYFVGCGEEGDLCSFPCASPAHQPVFLPPRHVRVSFESPRHTHVSSSSTALGFSIF